jgi:hypothetical protein
VDTQGEFKEEERAAAAEWRERCFGYSTGDVIELLTVMGVYKDRPCSTLADVRCMTDDVISCLGADQQLCLGYALLGASLLQDDRIFCRFESRGQPPLASFAPYVDFALRVELFYHLAVNKSRLAAAHRMDICYLYCLPFCHVFVSKDWVHKQCAPLFMRPDQEFVSAEDLKVALRVLNDQYSALPNSERCKSIHELAPNPPELGDNLVTKLWDRHWPRWRKPKVTRATNDDLQAATAALQEQIDELEIIAKARAGDSTPTTVEELDVLIRRRVTRKKEGKWWLVPEELRKPRGANDEQVFEFHNGATPDNIIDQELDVYIRDSAPVVASMRKCHTFVEEGKLNIDCAPPLNRRYTPIVPNGAMFARSTDDATLAVFVLPTSELARLIQKLWKKEEDRGNVGEW